MLSQTSEGWEKNGVRQDTIAQDSISQKQTPSYQWSVCPHVDIYSVSIVKISGNVNSVNTSVQQPKHTTRVAPTVTNTGSGTACIGNLSFLGTKYKPCIASLQRAKPVKYIPVPHCISLTHPWADAFFQRKWIALKAWLNNLRNYCRLFSLASVSPVNAELLDADGVY